MDKLLRFPFLCFVLISGVFLTSCTDRYLFDMSDTIETRLYEQDAEILSRFVDIDMENGWYYLNTQRGSFFDLLPQSYRNELNLVAEENRQIFLREMEILNRNLASVIDNGSSDFVVFSTPRKYVTKKINPNSTIEFFSKSPGTSTRLANQSHSLSLTGFDGAQNQLNFNSGKYVDCLVDITASGGSNFLITISDSKSNATPNGSDPTNPYSITYSGYGSYSGITRWTHSNWGNNLQWNMESYIANAPTTGNAVFSSVQ